MAEKNEWDTSLAFNGTVGFKASEANLHDDFAKLGTVILSHESL